MPDNFYKTAERTMDASEILDGHQSEPSHIACYLAGYVVECAGKEIVMQKLQTTPEAVAHAFVHNLKDVSKWLVALALDATLSANIPPGHWPEFEIDAPTILKGIHKWQPGKRYQENCGWDAVRRGLYLTEARSVMQKLTQLRVAGII